MPNAENALLEYQNKLHALHAGFAHAQTKQSGAVAMLALALAVFVLLCIAAYSSRRAVPVWLPPVILPVALIPFQNLVASRREALRLVRLRRFYQSGVDRLKGDWKGKGSSGEEFSRTNHVYERDLNLFGAGSMFELLCTTRSQVASGVSHLTCRICRTAAKPWRGKRP
jgi:hypothetical protein